MIPADHCLWLTLAFVWGAVWGSFTNVVVHRLPLGESVVRPGSRCGSCRQPIPVWHNIPILSFFVLRGRCASCGVRFSVRYPLVEAALAVLSLAIWLQITWPLSGGDPPAFSRAVVAWFFLFFFVADLTAIALVDLDTMRIPDVLSLPAIPAGLLCALLAGDVTGVDIHSSLVGMLVGGGTLLCVTYGYYAITGREGMGLGDYRLMAAVGAFLGWKSLLFLLLASALQGIVFFVVVRATGLHRGLPRLGDEGDADSCEARGAADPVSGEGMEPGSPGGDGAPAPLSAAPEPSWRRMAIPFGPFIVLSAIEWLLFEPFLVGLFERWVYAA